MPTEHILGATPASPLGGGGRGQVVFVSNDDSNTLVKSTAYEASHVLKASPGTLVAVSGYNSLASAQFIQVFNSITVPANAAVPAITFTVPASSNFSYNVPTPFTTGISASNSTTGPTKTIGAANIFFYAIVR